MPSPPPSRLRRLVVLCLTVTAIPIFPLLLLGLAFEDRVEAWVAASNVSAAGRFGLVAGVLAADILLPIPSSAVVTWAGGVMGFAEATLAATAGMTAGAAAGFQLARMFGRRFVYGRAAAGDVDRSEALLTRVGPVALVLTRPLPILAEACVLLVGTTGLTWRRFLPPVVLSNVVVAATYSAAGAYFKERGSLPAAVILSGTIPLLAALLARRWLPGASPGDRAEDVNAETQRRGGRNEGEE